MAYHIASPGIIQGNFDQTTLLIDIASRNVVCLALDASLGEAARIMAEKRISSIVVTNEDRYPMGIVTERNILQAMQSGFQQEMALQKIMSSPVIAVPESMTCLRAYQICLHDGIRHLVIVDDDKLVLGVVSETDFRLHINLTTLAGYRQVASVMSRSASNLSPEASLREALDLMQSHRDTCVVVVEAERPIGIVTERDIVRLYSGNLEQTDIPVREVMTFPVLSISLDNTINEAAERMLSAKVRHLVVVDRAGRMAGLINEHNLSHNMMLNLIDDKQIAEDAFLHTLMNTIPDLVWLKDVNGVYLTCNQRFGRIFGAKEKDIIGKTDYEFIDKERADLIRNHDRKALENNEPSINEEYITFADDGHRALFETIKTPMRDVAGKLIGVLGIARDITIRRQLEDKLRQSEEKFRNIFESVGDCIEIISMDGHIVDLNNVSHKSLGYTKAEMQGKRLSAFGTPEYAAKVPSRLAQIKSQGHATFESARQRKDGSVMPIEVSSRLIELDGQPVFISVNRDITERKRAEAALAQSEYRYRTLVENSPLCIHEIDLEGCLQSMNKAGLNMLELSEEKDICGIPYLNAVNKQDRERIKALLQDAINGTANHFEFSAAGDVPRYFKSCFVPIKDADGNVQKLMGLTEDITVRKNTERLLAERESLFSAIFEQAPTGIELIDPETLRFVEANPAACQMLGYTHEEFLRLRLTDTQAEMNEEMLAAAVQQVKMSGSATFENRHRTKNGDILDVEICSRILSLSDKPLLVGIWRDITEHKRAEENLRIIASVFDNSQEAIMITDANNAIIDVNPAFTHITGYSREEVLGRNPKMLSSGRQDKYFYRKLWQSLKQNRVWRGEIWNRRRSGEIYAGLLSIASICDNNGKTLRYVAICSDISPIKAHEAELSRIAHYDMLTGIPNRVLLADRLSQAMIRGQRSGTILAICYMDLDGFKQVNDQYGHDAGDKLLVDVSRRLQENLRAGDTLARLGGDEFVLLFNDLESEQECLHVLSRILDNVATPILIGNHKVLVSASIGVTFYPLDNEDGDTLLRHADQAMYHAKQTGKNRYHLYDSEHDLRVRALHESRRRILQGLEDGEFELFYQPKIELASGAVAGAEALIRWHHPELGLLLPAKFLPFIEGSDLEIQLGKWVMDRALSQLDMWNKEGLSLLEVSINISARHLQSPDFIFELELRLLKYPQLLPGRLQIEVLETAALENIAQSSETIEACRNLGVSFALDDFGTGYSSLTYLRKLSAEALKIDQSFVREMLIDEGDHAIVKGVVALAKTFDCKTVAEGVEGPEHIRALIEIECMYGQGYGIAHPMPAGEFLKWYRETSSLDVA
ncbi:MAG TPA: PAS domain S-box protein [Methylobacter sp.]